MSPVPTDLADLVGRFRTVLTVENHYETGGLGTLVSEIVAERGQAFGGGQEVRRDQRRALVDQLVERVLAVGAGLAPDDRPGGVVDRGPVAPHRLAVALHVGLLEIGRQAMEMLVVRQDGMALGAEEVAVPDAEQG